MHAGRPVNSRCRPNHGVNAPMVIDTGATSGRSHLRRRQGPPDCLWSCWSMTSTSRPPAGTPGGPADARPPCHRQARRAFDTGARGAARKMKTNLLGMSFLDRWKSWEVHADRLSSTAIHRLHITRLSRPQHGHRPVRWRRARHSLPAPGLTPFSARWRRTPARPALH